MSDAAEVLAAVYASLDALPHGTAFVNACFGLRVREQLHCARCAADTRVHAFVQRMHTASATGLRFAALAADPGAPPASLVRLAACMPSVAPHLARLHACEDSLAPHSSKCMPL
jgi:hypothetical protein